MVNSGSGKTTLISAIVGRSLHGCIRTGLITLNGQSIETIQERTIGFVEQRDYLIPYLTPEEHLHFQVNNFYTFVNTFITEK